MKTNILLLLIWLTSISCMAQYQVNADQLEKGYYMNPIFPGDYPDPSILVDGKDYYIVHSSFEYYPGLLIWHSTDLINWTPLTHALKTYVGSVWAPDMVKYEGKYYIYFPASNTNYVVYADNIEGPWSEPIELDIESIDPGHITDDEGNRYLYFSNGSYVPLSKDGLKVTGELTHSYDGWKIPREWSIECFCMEGPKLFKRGDYYYLTVAEGGTAGPATGHMVISARSKSPLGPWENSPYNPITRAQSNDEHWASVAHATPFEDAYGKWWMIYHGYENGFYNMGRQTFLMPLEWTNDGWYKLPDDASLSKPVKMPEGKHPKKTYSLNDSFDGKTLNPAWRFFEEYNTDRFELTDENLIVEGKGEGVANSSPILLMPSHHAYTADIELEVEGDAVGGLILFYNKQAFSGILADSKNILTNLRGWQFVTEKDVIKRKVWLRLKAVNNTVDMYYSLDGKNWTKTENSAEVSGLHHNVLSGFMALRIGLVSMGKGKVIFKDFKYTPIK
ncbi:family 43 glycosylhydrolase [Fulvivirga maritima]|uniref:family 43 glycosylhydrolase n=1 Tax=Fulvivirga maritima TaxID=2904247 RepID=UPI001F3B5AB7|nr:family 43 glycosylhydrolase [Fulvivirga maritima]UII26832.1 family 43 glycosylhydrolase [Fulvivirga maritima]